MNRNVEAHFSELPSVDLQRSKFDRSSSVKFSGNIGDLIPFYVDEVIPGDTFQIDTSKIVRLQTLLTPVMDNVYLDFYWFFVPNRIVWSHWREFMGENTQSAWIPETQYSVPLIRLDGSIVDGVSTATGSIFDYMGIPVQQIDGTNTGHLTFNALPVRAYWEIFNEWFRDENLVDPLLFSKGDSQVDLDSGSAGDALMCFPQKVAKYHDYFTSCLPSSQKAAKQVPLLSGLVPVTALGFSHNLPQSHVLWKDFNAGTPGQITFKAAQTAPNNVEWTSTNPTSGTGLAPVNLYANLGVDATQFIGQPSDGVFFSNTINSLRFAFQLQKLYEKDARGGTRYIEILKSHFGVTSPDARLQRPEYLGGNRVPLAVHQVTNNAQAENAFLGDLGAMSVTSDVHSDFTKSFVEHGFVIGLCCARYDHTYQQGLERMWLRRGRFDYYWPVFANIGEQPVYKAEIFATQANCTPMAEGPYDISTNARNRSVFGFQEAWADYRYKPNRVACEMRSGISATLDSWHLADDYETEPTLSSGWIAEDKTNVDRVLAVTSAVSNQFFADIYVKCECTRPMPLYSVPGLIDHH